MVKRRDLLAEALALPPEERRALAQELLASVDDDIDAVDTWLDVAEIRSINKGQEAQGLSWSRARVRSFSAESRRLLARVRAGKVTVAGD